MKPNSALDSLIEEEDSEDMSINLQDNKADRPDFFMRPEQATGCNVSQNSIHIL